MIETLLALYILCMIGMFAYSLLQLHLTFVHRRLRRRRGSAPAESAPGELPLITVICRSTTSVTSPPDCSIAWRTSITRIAFSSDITQHS